MDMRYRQNCLRFLQTGNRAPGMGDVQTRSVNVRIILRDPSLTLQLSLDKTVSGRSVLSPACSAIFVRFWRVRQKKIVLVWPIRFLQFLCQRGRKSLHDLFLLNLEACLKHYHWPGMVRGTAECWFAITIVMNDGQAIEAHMLPDSIAISSVCAAEVLTAGNKDQQLRKHGVKEFRLKAVPRGHDLSAILATEQGRYRKRPSRAMDGQYSPAQLAALEISPVTIYRKRQSWFEPGAFNGYLFDHFVAALFSCDN